jgi:hypothetical protein
MAVYGCGSGALFGPTTGQKHSGWVAQAGDDDRDEEERSGK